jgi:hypothetical protein
MGLVYSLLVYLCTWILFALGLEKPSLLWNFDKWSINLVISGLVAYLLWHFKMWAAGDAKLFICYASLIPMAQYSRAYFNYYFASFLLLLWIFIPATAFFLLKSGIYFIKSLDVTKVREKMIISIKKKFNKIEKGKILLGFFVFFLFFKMLREELTNLISKFLFNQNILILISLLMFKQLSKFFRKNTKLIIIISIILTIYISSRMIYSRRQLILEIGNIFGGMLSLAIFFPIFEKIIELYEDRTVRKTTPFAHWMFLGALIVWFI